MTALTGAPVRGQRTWLAVLCTLVLIPLGSAVGAFAGNLFVSVTGVADLGANATWDRAEWPIFLLAIWAPQFITGLIAGLLALGIVGLIFRRRARLITVAWVTALVSIAAAAIIALTAWPYITADPRFVGFLSFGLGLVLGLLIISGTQR